MTLFPVVEPDASGMLVVGDGHEIRWETGGNPDGVPVVVLHGGPGPGSSAGMRRFFVDVHYLLLDCSDEPRRRRIERRPPWRGRQIDEQIRFAHALRATIGEQLDTTHATPDDTAAAVAAWVDSYLG